MIYLLELNKTFSKILKSKFQESIYYIRKNFYLHGINRMLVNLFNIMNMKYFKKKII